MLGRQLAGGIAGLLFTLGAGAIVAPRRSAAQGYGVPVADAAGAAFVRATGARDVILGAIIVAVLDDAHALARLLRLAAFVGVADAAVVVSARGLRPQLVVHLGGVLAIAAVAAFVDHDL